MYDNSFYKTLVGLTFLVGIEQPPLTRQSSLAICLNKLGLTMLTDQMQASQSEDAALQIAQVRESSRDS